MHNLLFYYHDIPLSINPDSGIESLHADMVPDCQKFASKGLEKQVDRVRPLMEHVLARRSVEATAEAISVKRKKN